MKSVLISIQPKWCELIAICKKTIEVRKTAPKEKESFKVYIYQTKKKWIYKLFEKLGLYQGKVIGEFVCDRIDNQIVFHKGIFRIMIQGYGEKLSALCKSAALSLDDLHDYIDTDGSDFEIVYGWHISDLKIYDKPRGLGEFYRKVNCAHINTGFCKICANDCKYYKGEFYQSLTRPPQSWCYVEEL